MRGRRLRWWGWSEANASQIRENPPKVVCEPRRLFQNLKLIFWNFVPSWKLPAFETSKLFFFFSRKSPKLKLLTAHKTPKMFSQKFKGQLLVYDYSSLIINTKFLLIKNVKWVMNVFFYLWNQALVFGKSFFWLRVGGVCQRIWCLFSVTKFLKLCHCQQQSLHFYNLYGRSIYYLRLTATVLLSLPLSLMPLNV